MANPSSITLPCRLQSGKQGGHLPMPCISDLDRGLVWCSGEFAPRTKQNKNIIINDVCTQPFQFYTRSANSRT